MISVRLGRLDEVETQALLRPVRSDFSGLTGASRRVEVGAGTEVRARLDGMGDLPVGGAVVTPGGDPLTPFIIHAVLESPEESMSLMGTRRALMNGLRRASEWEMASLSLPPLGFGVGALDAEEYATMMIDVLTDHQREGVPPSEIVIVVEAPYDEELFRRLLAVVDLA